MRRGKAYHFQIFRSIFRYQNGSQCLWNERKQLLFFTIKSEAVLPTARAVANGGRIPIARAFLVVRKGCIPHLGSDPYWRVGVDVFWVPASIPGRVVRPAAQ